MFAAGLFISALGIGITFMALGVLVLVIWLLRVLFPERGAEKTPEKAIPTPNADLERKAAVIAAAWYWRSQVDRASRAGNLGSTLRRPRGNWWRAGSGRGSQEG